MAAFTRRNLFVGGLGYCVTAENLAATSMPLRRRLFGCRSWIVYYGAEADCETLSCYDIVILDQAFRGSIQQCRQRGAKVLGYLSLGEISTSSSLFSKLGDPSAILSSNTEWPGALRVDIRKPAWRALILEKGIPDLIERGFAGIFFDTLDTPLYLEQIDPIAFRGMRLAAIELVRSARKRFPDAIFAMNRGYDLISEIGSDVDAVIAESFLTTFNTEKNKYRWVDAAVVAQQINLLASARKAPLSLPVLSLDYWDYSDTKVIREIYRRERALGNIPYVGTPLLNQIIPEPPA